MKKALILAGAVSLSMLAAGTAPAATIVKMNRVNDQGVGALVGQVEIRETEHGLVFRPDLQGLPSGLHGFHVHEQPSCDAQRKDGEMTAAAAAGGHFDPHNRDAHGTPWGSGHLGDLPALYVNDAGRARQPVLAPRLSMQDLEGRALIVHAGGDNYSDHPQELGGGGSRLACGVIGASR